MLLRELRFQNVRRCEEVYHKIEEWSPSEWACAFAGETGEACNKVKKLRRLEGVEGEEAEQLRQILIEEIAEEVADAVIYADLLTARIGKCLETAIRDKFNKVSKKMGSEIYL